MQFINLINIYNQDVQAHQHKQEIDLSVPPNAYTIFLTGLTHGLPYCTLSKFTHFYLFISFTILERKHIRCKPTSPYKPYKLQSRLPDQHLKGMVGFDYFTINHPPLNWIITLLQILTPTLPAPSPWMLIWWYRLKFARFARKDWFEPDMFPIGEATSIFSIGSQGVHHIMTVGFDYSWFSDPFI